MNGAYGQKTSSKGLLLWVTLFLIVLFLVSLYLIGAGVEKEKSFLPGSVNSSVVILSDIDTEKFDKELPENVSEIIVEFYESNNSKFSLPEETKIGWQEFDGEFLKGETLTSFSVLGSDLTKTEALFAKNFLEARGFILSSQNSREVNSETIEGFKNKENLCILNTLYLDGGLIARQKLSCT